MFSSARSGAVGLAHTQFAEATCGTIRLKLLKLAGLVRISARRIKFALASACPYADEWRLAAARLARLRRRRDANKIAAIHPAAHRRPETDPTDPRAKGATEALVPSNRTHALIVAS